MTHRKLQKMKWNQLNKLDWSDFPHRYRRYVYFTINTYMSGDDVSQAAYVAAMRLLLRASKRKASK